MPSPQTYAKDDSEHSHQVALFMWAAVAARHGFETANHEPFYAGQGTPHVAIPVPELGLLYAIPNGGERNIIVATRMKAEGVKAGVSDLFLPVARRGCHGLYIEMKKPKGKGRPDQLDFIEAVKGQGYWGEVCDHWRKAADLLTQYITSPRWGE